MSKERLLKILLAPVVSEKSARVADQARQVVFKVVGDATKPEVKAAVEELFEVKVAGVSVANVKGKQKRFRQGMGRRPSWKKAYVTLQEGFDIDFAAAE
ncbi:50S ribosomal protein L23 [Endothiovibrio diazotrophicus]